ncbi:hypothetical protein INT47_010062 [Mucor saturninus]|uniref:Uncharacterized protein n=1 Tax=Mucor saturninus TaxID=64648 RepID=A0A8H7V6S4_9FUNG|nr:hypothetical protein INT47_010062 [Mucor saturninus]
MAPIKVIGASFGDCDTDNLKTALNTLGYKTQHMESFFEDPSLSCDEFYDAYTNRKEADWDALYKNYDAVVGWIGASFYKDLLDKYPDAKVVMTVRSVDSWYLSVKNTSATLGSASSHPFQKLSTAVCLDGWIQDPDKFSQEEKVKQMYLDHLSKVKEIVPAGQLLMLKQGHGWKEICKFLNKDVPDTSYPSANHAIDFERYYIPSERPHLIPTIRITTV